MTQAVTSLSSTALYPYKVVLSEQPTLWPLYKTLTALIQSPHEKSHIYLKGAWHALDQQEYGIAEEFAKLAHNSSVERFYTYMIDLELLKRQGRSREIPQRLLQIAETFQRHNMAAQEVKAYKRLAQIQPQATYYEKVIALYTQIGKVQKAIAWTKMLGTLRPPSEAKAPPPAVPPRSAQQRISEIAFGKDLWAKFFGDVGVEPPLPRDIEEVLSSRCPIWHGKTVRETHLLVLIPETVNGKPLNLKTLGELIQKPLQGEATEYRYFDLGEYQDPAAPKSHWALLSRDILPGSRNQSYQDQQAQVASIREKTKLPYEVPTILDATVCILMEYFRTNTYLYSQNPWTFTRCQEKYDDIWQLFVGGFAPAGLGIIYFDYDHVNFGVGVLRKFF